jgi:hypothetical protein
MNYKKQTKEGIRRMLKKQDLSVSITIHGAIEVSAIVGNYYKSMIYYGYSKREAMQRFIEDNN